MDLTYREVRNNIQQMVYNGERLPNDEVAQNILDYLEGNTVLGHNDPDPIVEEATMVQETAEGQEEEEPSSPDDLDADIDEALEEEEGTANPSPEAPPAPFSGPV